MRRSDNPRRELARLERQASRIRERLATAVMKHQREDVIRRLEFALQTRWQRIDEVRRRLSHVPTPV